MFLFAFFFYICRKFEFLISRNSAVAYQWGGQGEQSPEAPSAGAPEFQTKN